MRTTPATGPGSVTGLPGLPAGFTDTFTSQRVHVNGIDLHAVTGGDGPPLLLIVGWPQTWYAWRLVMPALARDYSVIAVDPRGVGLSDKPAHGYDTGTLATDMNCLMHALGHQRYGVVGHDVGMWTAYALASDYPDAVDRVAVAEAIIPGVLASPPLFGNAHANERLWHFAFNRLDGLLNEALVEGREDIYFGGQFATKATVPLAATAVTVYLDALRSSPDALRSSFEFYRAIDDTMAQNAERMRRPLTSPVLAVGGADSVAAGVARIMRTVADDVRELVLPDCGHYPAEEAPEALLEALQQFFAPYGEMAGEPLDRGRGAEPHQRSGHFPR